MPAVLLWLPLVVVAAIGLTSSAPPALAEPLGDSMAGAGEIVVAAAGDIANCSHDRDEATAQVLDAMAPDRVLTLGDNAYSSGTDAEFAGCYHPTWGRHRDKTHPSPGNHDYQTGGATGYFNYFGAAAGDPTKGYYAFDLGGWRFYALNSNCGAVSCAAGSEQEQWLRTDLAQNPRTCTAAFMHHPRYASGHTSGRRNNPSMAALFQAFYDLSGDLWLVAHNHQYERLTRLDPSGAIDLQRGVRMFVVGTGGAALYAFGEPITGSEVRNNTTHGVLKLTLRDDGYDWAFVPIAGSTFTDSGTDVCGAAPNPGNAAPIVNAGLDQTIALTSTATLDGTVTDDSQPSPPALTTTWTATGPGPVAFGDPGSVDTTASFSQVGTYVLRLTADDGALSSFDELTVNVTDGSPPPSSGLYFSLRAAGTVGGLSAANEDIVFFDGTWKLAFDGSDVGLGSLRIDAFSWLDADSLLLSFDAPGSAGGVAFDDSDVVRFEATSVGPVTAGSFSLHFDGSDVGLTTDAEDLDAVELLPGGQILVSSVGAMSVSGVSVADEDLVSFTPTSLGDVTAGSFLLYFDGSDVGLGDSGEDIDAAAVDASGSIYLSATDVFGVPGVSGQDEDVFVFTPSATGSATAGSYASALHFDGSTVGLGGNDVFAIDLP